MDFIFGALINLNHPDRYFHWHFIDISWANIIVVILMIVTFIVALVAPFPGRQSRKDSR
jgi:hypothetical protein